MVDLQVVQHIRKPVLLSPIIIVNMLKRKHHVIPICASAVRYSPYDTATAKWAARVGLFLSNLIIESTAPFVLISIGIRMRNSNKVQNGPIQAAHRVDLGAFYQCLTLSVLQIPFTVLFIINRAMPRSQGSRSRPTYFYFTFHWIKIR